MGMLGWDAWCRFQCQARYVQPDGVCALSHLYATPTIRSYMASRFKLPKADTLGHEWVKVSYMQFQTDIEWMAKF